MTDQHRFIVTGLDAEGDRHSFETDDAARAEAMLCQFGEDLEVARLSEREPATEGGVQGISSFLRGH
jgi:hypothetical protein